jgi:hypothetical protein
MSETMKQSFQKKKWAVVGAHNDPARYGYKIFHVLRDRGFDVYPIHPRLKKVDGVDVYASLGELPEKPDVAVMVVNPQRGIKVMEDIRGEGISPVWMQPGTRSDEIREYAREHGIELVEDCVLTRIDRYL